MIVGYQCCCENCCGIRCRTNTPENTERQGRRWMSIGWWEGMSQQRRRLRFHFHFGRNWFENPVMTGYVVISTAAGRERCELIDELCKEMQKDWASVCVELSVVTFWGKSARQLVRGKVRLPGGFEIQKNSDATGVVDGGKIWHDKIPGVSVRAPEVQLACPVRGRWMVLTARAAGVGWRAVTDGRTSDGVLTSGTERAVNAGWPLQLQNGSRHDREIRANVGKVRFLQVCYTCTFQFHSSRFLVLLVEFVLHRLLSEFFHQTHGFNLHHCGHPATPPLFKFIAMASLNTIPWQYPDTYFSSHIYSCGWYSFLHTTTPLPALSLTCIETVIVILAPRWEDAIHLSGISELYWENGPGDVVCMGPSLQCRPLPSCWLTKAVGKVMAVRWTHEGLISRTATMNTFFATVGHWSNVTTAFCPSGAQDERGNFLQLPNPNPYQATTWRLLQASPWRTKEVKINPI